MSPTWRRNEILKMLEFLRYLIELTEIWISPGISDDTPCQEKTKYTWKVRMGFRMCVKSTDVSGAASWKTVRQSSVKGATLLLPV
ncbi:hypothetical protein AVEN_191222-1 [Araneus ventricosus]|uniref:Uncharacterized protein n=1 Tax=Araneus ventricosus TaxID=182803 RepID=A0A4Y2VSI5_ARAVE|nr:hypothetical protein AVEN_191222-1 [Araneus ventricosus]